MSIQADRWIKRMSMRPTFVAIQMVAQVQPAVSSVYYPPVRQEVLVNMTEEEMKAAIERDQAFNVGLEPRPGFVSYRPATPEDLLRHNWQPMISPFEPSNVRVAERNATKEEELIVLTHPENTFGGVLEALQKHRQSIKHVRRDPLLGLQITEKILSYGTSSFGYDVTLQDDFRIFTNVNTGIIDPLNFDEEKCLIPFKGDVCIIPPNSYILGVTREYFRIPRDVMVACVGKSTYARCGAIVNVTPIEPGFEGNVVIEVSNATSSPLKVYANQGIAQFMFFRGDEECEVSYGDKAGKYQGQTGMTLAKV